MKLPKCLSRKFYLMLLLKNLDFHTDENRSLTALDPPEYHDYLVMCLKMCQHKLQTHDDETDINTIEGTQRNYADKGMCFKTKALGETLVIQIEF